MPNKRIEEKTAQVTFALGATINMGNYQSSRVDISITRPCKDDEDAILTTLDDVKEMVKTEVVREMAAMEDVSDTDVASVSDLVMEDS